jgi:hypothetical protein
MPSFSHFRFSFLLYACVPKKASIRKVCILTFWFTTAIINISVTKEVWHFAKAAPIPD